MVAYFRGATYPIPSTDLAARPVASQLVARLRDASTFSVLPRQLEIARRVEEGARPAYVVACYHPDGVAGSALYLLARQAGREPVFEDFRAACAGDGGRGAFEIVVCVEVTPGGMQTAYR